MCGIAGMIDPRLTREEGTALLEGMLESIRHRGPDASSTWIDMPVMLGHNRLSIIDLTELGKQPMEYGDLVILHNGEIYNYLEIRAELEGSGYRFESESDTEVILAAYQEWGGDCVQRFVGMWAFAIWDRANEELFCSRDRFGIKPLYYIHSGDRFFFGSEYRVLKQSPLFTSDFNYQHMRYGLRVGGIVYRDQTYYECLRALPERCNLLFKNGTVRVSRYWDIDGTRRFDGTFEEKQERFIELFRDSVRLHMRSDVPVGGMLSGGLDSGSIASVVGQDFAELPYRTYTINYDGWERMDETPWAETVIAAYPNIEPSFQLPSDDEVAESYDSAVEAHEIPLRGSSPLSCFFIMKAAARDGLKVMLDGQGADEYLAGYDPAFDRHIAGHLRGFRFFTAARALNDFRMERSADLKTTLRVAMRGVAASIAGERLLWLHHFRPTVSEILRNDVPGYPERVPGSLLNQNLYHHIFGSFLPSLLHYQDRMSMAWSVESRVPFLDHRLVEFGFSLDDDDKLREGKTKYILRKSLRGIVPEKVLARRDKQPFFGGEICKWLRGPLRHLIELPLSFDGLDFFDNRKAAAVLQAFKSGNNQISKIAWNIVNLNYWLRRH